ncbi:MAG TPA: aspartate--tRNA(Asn) ligase [Anaerolineae bacterium]|nr:aspartate--tRNA(Asn) ligase [Anaerolineae bacterium]HOQ97320.1 aspartate--tRNA(Asn) ligase [Anaerolineae bacterium]HOQ97349.1 aspartate--tRNA(Asn) ligase [Anaerolineae bacterium]HPL27313.1 aspartate--tRNA(Asn) ligase [Anaerolineae bacterium]
MERIMTTQLAEHIGERVLLQGWRFRLRRLGGINFLALRDGWGIAQAVLDEADEVATVAPLPDESVLAIEGVVAIAPQAPGGFELRECRVHVLSPAEAPPPFELNKRVFKPGLDVFLDHAAVGLRQPQKRAIFRLGAAIMHAYRGYLYGEGFTEIQTPKLVGTATEGGANVFPVDYLGRTAYLAQSPQFYKQIMVGVYERVFEVGPVFRAEPHNTARHINEYVSLDAEMGFVHDHHTVMGVLSGVMRAIVGHLGAHHEQDLALLEAAPPHVPEAIPEVYFPEALEMIWRETGRDVRGEPDLAPEDERWLGEWARERYESDWVFVTGYPMAKRPFYTHPNPADPAYSNSFDLLFRGTELVTGGQRLHRYEDYVAALEARRLNPEDFAGYLEAFRHGMPPHGGFAIGLERFLMQLLGLANIRETTLFPRDLTRLAP